MGLCWVGISWSVYKKLRQRSVMSCHNQIVKYSVTEGLILYALLEISNPAFIEMPVLKRCLFVN